MVIVKVSKFDTVSTLSPIIIVYLTHSKRKYYWVIYDIVGYKICMYAIVSQCRGLKNLLGIKDSLKLITIIITLLVE